MLSRLFALCALTLLAATLTGCITQPAADVSGPLQPHPGEPVAYLVGAIGPLNAASASWQDQRLLLRKRGSEYGAAAVWHHQPTIFTPQDVKDSGSASVFVMALKPGDYELYDAPFSTLDYVPGVGTMARSQAPREKFNLPLRLEAGKAYYLGEFRSYCFAAGCAYLWRDQLHRDQPLAQRQVPSLPTLQALPLNLNNARPYIVPAEHIAP
ncbi:hypothetical protein [Pseudomonas sp. TE3610]